jgi:hypothetical protein
MSKKQIVTITAPALLVLIIANCARNVQRVTPISPGLGITHYRRVSPASERGVRIELLSGSRVVGRMSAQYFPVGAPHYQLELNGRRVGIAADFMRAEIYLIGEPGHVARYHVVERKWVPAESADAEMVSDIVRTHGDDLRVLSNLIQTFNTLMPTGGGGSGGGGGSVGCTRDGYCPPEFSYCVQCDPAPAGGGGGGSSTATAPSCTGGYYQATGWGLSQGSAVHDAQEWADVKCDMNTADPDKQCEKCCAYLGPDGQDQATPPIDCWCFTSPWFSGHLWCECQVTGRACGL